MRALAAGLAIRRRLSRGARLLIGVRIAKLDLPDCHLRDRLLDVVDRLLMLFDHHLGELLHLIALSPLPGELRQRDCPPVTGAEALEVSKAAARLPRERFNELMEQLLDEIQRSGREIKKARRLMVIGNDLHNATQMEALESLDAVVVVDEMNCGIRYAWGQVDTQLPPMEALAIRGVFGIVFCLPVIFVLGYGRDLRRLFNRWVVLRSLCEVAAVIPMPSMMAR